MSIPVSAPTAYHGIKATVGGVSGLIQSISFNRTPDEVVAQDGQGNVANYESYNWKSEFTCEVTFPTGTWTLQLADIIAISGAVDANNDGSYFVTGVTENESNVDFVKLTVTGRRYEQNALPAASV